MQIRHSDRKTNRMNVTLAVAAAFAAAGCASSNRQMATGESHLKSAGQSVANTGQKGSPLYVPPGKQRMTGFNPFWFEGAAEANWESRRGRAAAVAVAVPMPMHPVLNAAPESPTPLADVMEGLTHVTARRAARTLIRASRATGAGSPSPAPSTAKPRTSTSSRSMAAPLRS